MAAFLFFAPRAVLAQRPSTADAQRLLQTRPDLVAQLRQRIATSNLTTEQIRARLRAEGYPESLLDAYLSDARPSVSDSMPRSDVFRAVRALGIADSVDVAELEASARAMDTTGGRGRQRRDERDERIDQDDRGRRRTGEPRTAEDSLRAGRGDRAERDTLDMTPEEREEWARERSRRIFGLEVFRRSTTQFDANVSGPVDANYRLGPGDQLVLILTGDVEEAYTLDVTREGFVVIPRVGQIAVANLTLGQLNDVLYSRLGRAYSGVRRGAGATTRFSVSVARLRSNQVFVVGDVDQPGSYRVSSAGTALSALYAAGGPTENGSLRAIEVRRGGRTTQTLDLYDYLLRGDASRDPRLETGDVVFVPVHGPRVEVMGEVQRPATYELRPRETLADVLRMAGGFAPTASRLRVQIERIAPPGQRQTRGGSDRFLVDVASESFASDNAPAFAMEAGDIVRVFRIAARVRDRVLVRGNVWQPGTVGLTEGMMLSDALRRAGGVRANTYLGQVLVTRVRSDSTRVQLRATLRDTTGAVVNDIALREDDEIRVFSVGEFRPERYVAITGAVRRPGRFAYRDGITVRDLVLLAGGLQQSAYLQEAEVARLPQDRTQGQTATTFRVPLDSSYLFERGPDGRYLGPPGLPAPSASAPEQRLEPYDNVLILRQPEWQLQRSVAVSGEVRFPGVYSLTTKGERLSDVLRRAGGPTSDSYADGIVFYRRRDDVGRIGINLPRVLRNPRDRDNILLEDGDSVFLPRYNPVVTVVGAVNSPVAVAYRPGARIDYYIRRAGGSSRIADAGRAYVTQPNGEVDAREHRFLLFSGTPEPKAGSTVTVPAKDPSDRKDYTAIAGSVAQVIASLVAIIAIARR